MSKVHISIPELDERDLSYNDFFRIIHVFLQHKMHYIKALHPSNSIDDINAYPLLIVEKIIKLSSTLYSVINTNKDYVASNIIMRSLADYISTLFFIYKEPDCNIKLLRHYIFIIDGLKGRIKQLPKNLNYDGRIKIEEFNALKKQINTSLDSYKGACQFSEQQIKLLPIYQTNSTDIDYLIETSNWKFKTISRAKNNRFNWNELYDYLNLPIDSDFFSLLSKFVHGLSTSNLMYNGDVEDMYPILSISSSLLNKVSEFIDEFYKEDMSKIKDKMISAIVDDDVPRHYVERIFKSATK